MPTAWPTCSGRIIESNGWVKLMPMRAVADVASPAVIVLTVAPSTTGTSGIFGCWRGRMQFLEVVAILLG
jgi:hypothetical protein